MHDLSSGRGPSAALTAVDYLLPQPQKATATAGLWPVNGVLNAAGDLHSGPAAAALDGLKLDLEKRGVALRTGGRNARPGGLRLELGASVPEQGYRLDIGRKGALIRAATAQGLAYGVATLRQWLRLARAAQHQPEPGRLRIPGLRVEDWPDLAARGLMLDVSRNRVPRLPFLLDLVQRLADLKLNQLQLYTEHTFAYRGHSRVWRGWSPLRPQDLRRLDRHCRERGIELVPNQNSFGHLHRWLVHQPYRQLAECPQGIEHPFSEEVEPFGLCPIDPGSKELIADLYDQLLPCFSSRQLNAGLDETLDLGLGRSAQACAERGKDEVYLDFVQQIHSLAKERGRRLQMWGDIVLEHPELVRQLPADVLALIWGYEAEHPFAEQSSRFAAAGLDFYVCPGTSSWNSFTGRVSNSVRNLVGAAAAGHQHGAAGLLLCDWGDFGHLQPWTSSLPGLLAGADAAWNASREANVQRRLQCLPTQLECYLLPSDLPGAGEATLALGEAYLLCGARPKNGTVLFHLLRSWRQGLDHPRYEGMGIENLATVLRSVRHTRETLPAQASSAEGRQVLRELRWGCDALSLAARLGVALLQQRRDASTGQGQAASDANAAGSGNQTSSSGALISSLPSATRAELSRDLAALLHDLDATWLGRSRPGGLQQSRRPLEDLLAVLGP